MRERFPNWESRIQYWEIGDAALVQPVSCARAARGHAAAPPRSVMNSRRLMGSPG
jgi:hypothetical protein